MKYQKLIVDGKQINVFLGTSTAAAEAKALAHLKGVEIAAATPDEFLAYYESTYGLPDIGDSK